MAPPMEPEVYIFHEMQDSELCGQHCLNNLVQQAVFNTVDLAEIAQELDRMEDAWLDPSTASSSRIAGMFYVIPSSMC